jgi:hypothetical protein
MDVERFKHRQLASEIEVVFTVIAPYDSYTSPYTSPSSNASHRWGKTLKWGSTSIGWQRHAREDHASIYLLATCTHKMHQQAATSLLDAHGRRKRATTTRHPAARALRQPCRAPRVLVSQQQRLYIDYAVRRHDVVFWAYDYLDYLPRLVSTRKLVEDGSRDINN